MNFKILLSLGILFLQSQAMAKEHRFDQPFEEKIQKLLYVNGNLSPAKVDAYRGRLEQKRLEMMKLIEGKSRLEGETDQALIAKEVSKSKIVLALDVALQAWGKITTASTYPEILDYSYQAMDLEAAVRIYGEKPSLETSIKQTAQFLRRWRINKEVTSADEASNLFDPETGRYLDQKRISELKSLGADLSSYGPGKKSSFWQEQDVSKVKVADALNGRTLAPYKGLKLYVPKDLVFNFDKMRQSDTKPKMDVFAFDPQGNKVKYKLKFGAELHSDPTIAAMVMTLGFPADMTRYVRDVKVIFSKKNTFTELKREWEVYYLRDSAKAGYKIEQFIKSSGVTAEGDFYVIFKDGLIELKPEGVERIGGWSWKDNGHSSLREVRGLIMVQMWMDQTDMKEFDNNRLLLQKKADGRFERHHIIADLGHGFGHVYFEKPELFSNTMVASNSSSQITMQYRAFHAVSIKNKMTYADARWGAKLIASLSKEQISDAVNLGGWPQCVANILVEKLVLRRNDLIRNFELSGERLKDGKQISLMPESLAPESTNYHQSCDDEKIAEQFTTNFDFSLGYLMAPVARSIFNGLADLSRTAIGEFNKVVLSSDKFKLDTRVISEVIINSKRDVVRNTQPTTEKDIYLVQDHFEVGMRLGVAWGAYKDVVYTRSFTLAYPVRSKEEARFNNGFVTNLFLPLHVSRGQLPEKYVLKTEHYIEHGVGVHFSDMAIPVVLKAGVARIILMRSILDHKDSKQYVLYRDRFNSYQTSIQAFLKVLVVKFPVMRTLNQWGHYRGYGSVIASSEAEGDASVSENLRAAVVEGNFAGMKKLEQDFEMSGQFTDKKFSWNLFFWSGHNSRRMDHFTLERPEQDDRESIQYRSDRERSTMLTKEKNQVRVEVYIDPKHASEIELSINVTSVDKNTTDKEMAEDYVPFINGLSTDGKPIISLDPKLEYTVNKVWGLILVQSKTIYYPEAIKHLLHSQAGSFWAALAEASGYTANRMNELRQTYQQAQESLSSGDQVSRTQILRELGTSLRDYNLLKQSEKFLKTLDKVRAHQSAEGKVRLLAAAFQDVTFKNGKSMEPRILGAINRLVGIKNLYSSNLITVPQFAEVNLLDETPFYGEIGTARVKDKGFLIMTPSTPEELYYLLDAWI